MPNISGIFEAFENLDQIPTEDIARWLKSPPQPQILENYLANKLFYPQVIPINISDLNIDLAILREALKRNTVFYKPAQKKIFIPEDFINLVPDVKKLAKLFIDAYEPKGPVIFILSRRSGDEVLGSLVTVYPGSEKDVLHFEIEGKNFKIKPGSLVILPCSKERCHINFKSNEAKIFGKSETVFEVQGGRLGIIVDGRWK